MTAWLLDFDGYDPADEGRREALLTLGNGYMATRGAWPETVADGTHYPGTYVCGVYDRLTTQAQGRSVENESMVNLPNWTWFTITLSDGQWLTPDTVEILDHRVELDMRRGVLTRRSRFRDRRGRHTRLVQRRLVHLERPHVALLESRVVAEDWSGSITIRSGIDGRVGNFGVPRYRDVDGRHLQTVSTSRPGADTVRLLSRTNQSRVFVAQAATTSVRQGTAVLTAELYLEQDRIALDLTLPVRAGQEFVVDKLVSVFTSRDHAISEPALAAVEELAALPQVRELHESHTRAWQRLWGRFRVELWADSARLELLRLHVFHLLQTLSPNTVGRDVGVPARGLHGEAYRGHVFWDELFVIPMLVTRLPAVARSLLEYRYRRLPAARRAAAAAGLSGAMFPWQSGSDGREETQTLHLNPLSGRWLADATSRQRHVGLTVAFNVWQYFEATQDVEFMSAVGAEMMFEIASFWSSLARFDPARGRYVITGVMGPDEFHTGYPEAEAAGVDNNAYTNVVTAWVMARALDTVALLPELRRIELFEQLGLGPADLQRWEDMTRRILVPVAGGMIEQFEGYARLKDLDWTAYGREYGDLQRLDRILEAEGRSANHYQVSKQADVLMLLYLFSAEELTALLGRLGYHLEPSSIPAMVDYYQARTTHGSTLSAVVHAWVLARGHRSEAVDYFHRALASDAANVQGGTTAEGIHLAAMAGSLDLLQRCFAGVQLRDGALWFDPHWPATLGALEFDLTVHGSLLSIRVEGRGVTVTSAPGNATPVRCVCGSESVLLSPRGRTQLGARAE